jgi:2-iminobutanoate/2-iminopropanoate deaminase
MAERKAVHTDKAPAAIGPYSQAMLVGNTLYLSGQLGMDPATGKLVEGDTAAQAKQALNNIMAILVEANMNIHDIVQVQVFLADIGDFAAVNEVYKTFFAEPYPARAAIQAGALPAGASVEILATAIKEG